LHNEGWLEAKLWLNSHETGVERVELGEQEKFASDDFQLLGSVDIVGNRFDHVESGGVEDINVGFGVRIVRRLEIISVGDRVVANSANPGVVEGVGHFLNAQSEGSRVFSHHSKGQLGQIVPSIEKNFFLLDVLHVRIHCGASACNL